MAVPQVVVFAVNHIGRFNQRFCSRNSDDTVHVSPTADVMSSASLARRYTMKLKNLMLAALTCTMTLGIVACEKKGPMEQAGEEVDEAIDTMKNGKESTSSKLDDAADDVREGASDAADELKKD
jgi:hypothetical protein